MAVTGEGLVYLLDNQKLENSLAQAKSLADETEDETESDAAADDVFDSMGPTDPVSIRSGNYVAYNQSNGRIAVYDRGTLHLFKETDGEYGRYASLELNIDFDNRMSCVMDYQGDTVVLVFGNGQVITVDGNQLKERNSYLPEKRSAIESVQGSPDGRWFAVDLRDRETVTLAYVARAVTPGEYHHPAAAVEDMYRPRYRARTDTSRIVISP